MSAIPNQTLAGYEDNLRKVIALNTEHISAYSLIVEEGTPLYNMVERTHGKFLPSEDEDREMYAMTKAMLADAGYSRYEISNYAKPGRECRHNISYWERADYLGFGAAAASLIGKRRFTNTYDVASYIANPIDNHSEEQLLAVSDEMEEYMFLCLRMMKGVDTVRFGELFGKSYDEVYGSITDRQIEQGLMVRDGNRVCLTDIGIDVSNIVMAEYML